MCLITIADSVSDITQTNVKAAWRANKDGAGIVWITGRHISCRKGIMTQAALLKTLDTVPNKCPVAIHFRLATHGSVSRENTHPFKVSNGHWLMHNGILSGLGKSGTTDGRSDSAHLASILSRLDETDRHALLTELSGKYAYARARGIAYFGQFNEEKGVLYSNMYWRPTVITSYDYRGHYAGKTSSWNWDNDGVDLTASRATKKLEQDACTTIDESGIFKK